MKLFGAEIWGSVDPEKEKKKPPQQALEMGVEAADAAIVQADRGYTSGGGYYDGTEAVDRVPETEIRKISDYRTIAITSEVDQALTEIRNEVFVFDVPGKKAFEIDFIEECELPESFKTKLQQEFEHIYNATEFHRHGLEYFDDWYIDGRFYAQILLNGKSIDRIIPLNPTNMRMVKVLPRIQPGQIGIDLNKIEEFFVYTTTNDSRLKYGTWNTLNYGEGYTGVRINMESVAFAMSGLRDRVTGRTIGYLDKAVAPYNSLKMMEDAMVIFRVVRAPQRMAIYVDVGQLQKNKSDAYMKEIMARFKNKMVYDSKSGTLADRRNIMTMLENYWLPRREGSKGTEIQTIDGQDVSSVIDEVEWWKNKLWDALNVPRSRFENDGGTFMFGRGVEIQRDEYRFKKFLNKIRGRFLVFFEDLLRTQLILKKIIKPEEWAEVRSQFFWAYTEDNAFVEFKESELLNNRLNSLSIVEPHIGKFYSIKTVRKQVLRMTDEEIENEEKQMEEERKAGLYDPPTDDDGNANPDFFPGARQSTRAKSVNGNAGSGGGQSSESYSRKTTVVTSQ